MLNPLYLNILRINFLMIKLNISIIFFDDLANMQTHWLLSTVANKKKTNLSTSNLIESYTDVAELFRNNS